MTYYDRDSYVSNKDMPDVPEEMLCEMYGDMGWVSTPSTQPSKYLFEANSGIQIEIEVPTVKEMSWRMWSYHPNVWGNEHILYETAPHISIEEENKYGLADREVFREHLGSLVDEKIKYIGTTIEKLMNVVEDHHTSLADHTQRQ